MSCFSEDFLRLYPSFIHSASTVVRFRRTVESVRTFNNMLSKKNLFALWGGRVANGVGKVGEERPGSWQFVALSSCGIEVFVGE